MFGTKTAVFFKSEHLTSVFFVVSEDTTYTVGVMWKPLLFFFRAVKLVIIDYDMQHHPEGTNMSK